VPGKNKHGQRKAVGGARRTEDGARPEKPKQLLSDPIKNEIKKRGTAHTHNPKSKFFIENQ
jgi:hypothetical protein